mmetsp:Transcript_17947/g.37297  ORF Transcript_17947/g.37297 Transcript_17947/m.37297 type:complete len:382 (-) Transcript_17947:340-1485(-)
MGRPCVILAADTRATEGTLVADKRCDKIHKLASNCRCCGAGTSADLDKVTRQVLYRMALEELQGNSIGNGRLASNNNAINNNDNNQTTSSVESKTSGTEILYQDYGESNGNKNSTGTTGQPLLYMRPVSIDLVCRIFQDTLFRSGGQLGANLIVGGVWNNKPCLRAIHPHGSTDKDLPFAALGSGGLAAMAVLEKDWKPSLTLQEGIELVQRAILSGIQNDLGSGSQVDLCIIRGNGDGDNNIGNDIGNDGGGFCVQTRGVIREEELLPDGPSDNDSDDAEALLAKGNHRTNRLFELLARNDANEDGGKCANKDDDDDDKHEPKDERSSEILPTTTATATVVGVNGFGNQPFGIETTKQRMLSVEMDQTKRKEQWDRLLGL